jgi:hypothetical protein
MIARNSGTPLVTAEKGTKCAFVWRAIKCANVVLPEPGGPQKMMEESRSCSIARRNGRSGAVISSCPTKSSNRLGLIRSANGLSPGFSS